MPVLSSGMPVLSSGMPVLLSGVPVELFFVELLVLRVVLRFELLPNRSD